MVKKDAIADITLAGVNIDVSSDENACAFEIEPSVGDVIITLTDSKSNVLKSGDNRAGLEKAGTSGSLTIQCSHVGESNHICSYSCGFLRAESYFPSGGTYGKGAGIGSGSTATGGDVANITILGGSVNAVSGRGAGIGSGSDTTSSVGVSNITISGGSVNAKSNVGAGIGGGYNSGSVSDIKIFDGTVIVESRDGAGIGTGYNADPSSVTVSDIIISGGFVEANASVKIAGPSGPVIPKNSAGQDVYPSGMMAYYSDGIRHLYRTSATAYLYLPIGFYECKDGAGSGVSQLLMVGKNGCEGYFSPTESVTGGFTVWGNSHYYSYDVTNGVLTVKNGAVLQIANTDLNTETGHCIKVEDDAIANITLAGVNINADCAFTINKDFTGDVTITLADGTNNILKSGNDHAGLEKNGANGSLTIQCSHVGDKDHVCRPETCGSLDAASSKHGAGIGSGMFHYQPRDLTVANITIRGGNINASSQYGAGIGSGHHTHALNVSNITISGGNVTARSTGYGSAAGAGIGSGYRGDPLQGDSISNIMISGGCVEAISASGAGIGSGTADTTKANTVSNIIISGGSVRASGSSNDIGGPSAAVTPKNNAGQDVYLNYISVDDSDRINGVVFGDHFYHNGSQWTVPEYSNVYVYLPKNSQISLIRRAPDSYGDDVVYIYSTDDSTPPNLASKEAPVWLRDVKGTVKAGYSTLDAAVSAAENVDTVLLARSTSLENTLTISKRLNLELRSSIETEASAAFSDGMVKISPTGKLTLSFSGFSSLKIDASTITRCVYNAGAFVMNGNVYSEEVGMLTGGHVGRDGSGGNVYNATGGVFVMNGGIIRGGYAGYGAGVYNEGTFIMNGGTIENCTATNGGGVYNVSSSAKFTMENGKIENCTATSNGGGVFNGMDAHFTIENGTIKDCTAVYGGGGVINNMGSTFDMQGGVIKGRTANDGDAMLCINDVKLKNSSTTGATICYGNTSLGSAAVTGHIVRFKDGEGNYAMEIIPDGGKISAPDAPVHEGYAFIGWYDEKGNVLNAATTVSEPMTFTARYSISDLTRIDDLEKAKKDLETAVDGLNTAMGGKVDTSTLNTLIADLQTQLSTLNTNLGTKADASTVTTIESNISTINNTITQINASITALKNSIGTVDPDDDDLQTQIKNLDQALNNLNTTLTNAITAAKNAAIDEAESLVESAKNDLQSKINNKADASDLEDAVESLNNAIADLAAVKAAYVAADTALGQRLDNLIDEATITLKDAEDKLAKLEADMSKAQDDITKLVEDLKQAKRDLNKSILSSANSLSDDISALSNVMKKARTALENADADTQAALKAAISDAQTALDAAVAQIQADLDDAKSELEKELAADSKELNGKIADLEEALKLAEAASKIADSENVVALISKINGARETLEAAIERVEKDIEKLETKENDLEDRNIALSGRVDDLEEELKSSNTAQIVIAVVAGLAVAGDAALAVWIFLDRRKRKI